MKRYAPIDPSKFFARGSDNNSFTIPSTARLKKTSATHDVYFVFKGETAESNAALFPLAEIELRNEVNGD